MKIHSSPTPATIKAAREAAGLTQTAAGEVVFTSLRAWQQWEYGERNMHLAFWHLFLYKISLQEHTPDAHLSDPPLSPSERAVYAANLVQRRASFALEGMHPDFDDEVIQASILAGLVSPGQYRREMLAYVDEHKTLRGFLQSRSWAMPVAHFPELLAA